MTWDSMLHCWGNALYSILYSPWADYPYHQYILTGENTFLSSSARITKGRLSNLGRKRFMADGKFKYKFKKITASYFVHLRLQGCSWVIFIAVP